MSEKGDRRAIKAVVSLTQDNILMRKVMSLMAHFIIENGIFNVTAFNKTQQYYAVIKYFKTEALNQLIEKGYDMGVNTPWGYDVSKMIIHRDLSSDKYSVEPDDDIELEYEDEYEDDDLEDEEED